MINLTNIAFHYSKADALININLNLSQGHIYGLLGENGAGKSTLLKIMTGLLFATSGQCLVMGHDPKQRQATFLEEVYYLPEDIYVPNLSITEYVTSYASFYPRFNKELLMRNLAEFDLPPQSVLTALSYGQKKKFLIAFGIATQSRLLILDEPTNGLDIPSKSQFRKLLASNITDDKLFIISTHQVHDVENLIDAVVMMEKGQIIFKQTIFDIATRLAFVQSNSLPEAAHCFYSEQKIGGYYSLVRNLNQEDTHIDLEILFNAIRTNKTQIQALFEENCHD